MASVEKIVTNSLYAVSSAVQKTGGTISAATKPVQLNSEKLTVALDGLALKAKAGLKVEEGLPVRNLKNIVNLAIGKIESDTSRYQDLTYDKMMSDKQLSRKIQETMPEIFEKLLFGGSVVRKTKLYDRYLEKYVDAYIIKDKIGEISIHTPFEQLGKMTLCPAKEAYTVKSKLSNASSAYKKGDFLEIHSLETQNKSKELSRYKGIGTELVKQAVIESYKKGHSGRISCTSIWSSGGFYEKIGMQNATSGDLAVFTLPEDKIEHILLG